MDNGLIILLALATFGAVIAFAVWSRSRTQDRKEDSHAPKSHLAKDGPGPNAVKAANDQGAG